MNDVRILHLRCLIDVVSQIQRQKSDFWWDHIFSRNKRRRRSVSDRGEDLQVASSSERRSTVMDLLLQTDKLPRPWPTYFRLFYAWEWNDGES